MEAVLALLIVGWAIAHVYEDVTGKRRADRDKRIGEIAKKMPAAMTPSQRKKLARKHALGWSAREVLTGFPVTRTAWHSAWLSHKIASIQQRHQREEARSQHLEVTAGLAAAMADHKARQAVIQAEIDQAVEAAPEPPRTAKAVKQAARDADILPFRPKTAPAEPEQGPYAPEPASAAQPEPETCVACGHPGRPGDEVVDSKPGWRVHQSHLDDPSSGLYEPRDDNWPTGIPHRRKNTTTEGAPVSVQAETTYDQSIAEANQLIAESESEIARLQVRRVPAMVENLAAAAVDPGNLSHLADVDDAIQKQIQAAQQQLDSAQAFRDGLIRDHSAGADYHASAPSGGAEKSFFSS